MANEFKLVKLLDPVVSIDIPIRFAGEWNPLTTYQVGDIVTYNSGAYISLSASTGATPDTNPTLWEVIFNAPTIGTLASASVNADGSINSAFNCNVVNTSTGFYDITFNNATVDGSYPIVFGKAGINLNNFEVKYNNKTANGFSVNITDQDDGGGTGTPVNRAFSFYIPDLASTQNPPVDFFFFEQTTPALTWTINHNLGRRPVTELFTTGGVEFEAEVTHTSINQCIVTLTSALAGSARLI